MADEFFTKLDHITPASKMSDPKSRVLRREFLKKKKEKGNDQDLSSGKESEEEEQEGQMENPHCGKILDIII